MTGISFANFEVSSSLSNTPGRLSNPCKASSTEMLLKLNISVICVVSSAMVEGLSRLAQVTVRVPLRVKVPSAAESGKVAVRLGLPVPFAPVKSTLTRLAMEASPISLPVIWPGVAGLSRAGSTSFTPTRPFIEAVPLAMLTSRKPRRAPRLMFVVTVTPAAMTGVLEATMKNSPSAVFTPKVTSTSRSRLTVMFTAPLRERLAELPRFRLMGRLRTRLLSMCSV